LKYGKVEAIVFLSALLVLSSICLVFASPTATAFNQSEVSASISWSSTSYYPGAYGQAYITLTSNFSQNIQISTIGIHFDWNTANTYFSVDFKKPTNLQSDRNYTFDPVAFYVPLQENVSLHTFYVHFEGTQGPIATKHHVEFSNIHNATLHS